TTGGGRSTAMSERPPTRPTGIGRSRTKYGDSRRLICSWNSFKEFKYIAIYRDSHAVAKRRGIGGQRSSGPPGGPRQGVRSLHRPEASQPDRPGGNVARLPRPERRRKVHDDQDYDEPEPALPSS